jgi:hypothetical protein
MPFAFIVEIAKAFAGIAGFVAAIYFAYRLSKNLLGVDDSDALMLAVLPILWISILREDKD